MNIDQLRKDTPGCAIKVHFNNAGASLMPNVVIDAMINQIKHEAIHGGYESADIHAQDIAGFYQSAAQLIHGKANNIAFTSSATNSFARALSCIPFQQGDTILLANEDYISNQFAFLSLKKRFTLNVVRVASLKTGGIDVEHLKQLIDKHHPKLVSLTHIPTNTGLIQPVEEVGKICKEKNIYYLVDACQSVGQIPVDVEKIQCDFLSATLRKFLRGPRGAGFLYVSDKIINQKLEPLFIDMRGGEWTSADTYQVRMDARRFEDWELPYALVLGSKAAIDLANQTGIDHIQKRNQHLCNQIRNGLAHSGFRLLDIGSNQSSIITLTIPNYSASDVLQKLRADNINTSVGYRHFALLDFEAKQVDWALRISPHYFNTEEEVQILLAALNKLK